MKTKATLVLLYSLLIFAGGVIAYANVHSCASIIMATIFSVLLLGCSWAMFCGKVTGYFGAFLLTFLLAAFFTYRFASTGKFMPPGMMAIVSGLVLVALFALRKSKT